MVIDNNNTLTGLTLQPKKDPLNSLTIASSVAIPDNVTVIADSAFEGCHLLESVTLPSGLISIGEKAFYQCVNLASTALPNSVVSIGDNAFTGCFALPYETYDNAIYLGNDSNPYIALLRATSKDISSCTIHKDAQFVSSFAFANCSNLTTITLPSGVSAIGANAFEGCIALTSITFPSSVKHIGAHAFKDCTGLIALEIPSGVTSIGQGIFYGCTNLSSLTISSDNSVYKALGNCVIEKTSNVLVAGCANGTIPSNGTVTSIADEAFSGCYGVTSIVIPANVAKIGSKAFSDCKDLTQVTIPYTVTSIGKNAFSGCEKLAKVIYTSSAANWDDVSKVSDEWSSTLIEYTEAPENLIHVKTAGELIDLANSGDTFRWKTIYLDNDIDFNPGWSARAQIVGEKLSLPSQPENTWTAFENFMGTIDGQGHSISGLYTQRTVKGNKGSYGGLIDTASNGAIIKNLIIQNSIYVVENTSWGTTNIYVGGLVAKCDKTTSDNHYNALIISNVYVDMDIVWHCDEQCTLGGILGYAVRHDDKYTSPYNISNTVFAGRIINTNSSYTVPYASQEDKKFSMAQIVANTNWGSQHVLSNVLAAGEIISGNLGDSSVNAIFGSATATGVKQTNVVEGRKIELPASGWIYNDEIGYYVPESVYKLLQPYELAIKLANGNTAFAGFKLQLKDSTDPTNITRSTAGISVTIPEGVTTIYPRAFESVAPILESVTLPNTVISISAFAFEGCTALGTVTLPDALGSIGNSAFEGCTNLKVPAIPANVQVIGASAFKGCTSLTNLTLDNDGTVNLTIGDHAFEGCTGLKVNTIPAKVANIGMNAFKDCPNLTDLEFGYDGSANFDVGANAFDKIEILHVTPAFLFRFRNDDTMMKKNVTTIYVTSGDLLDKNYVVNYPKLTLINMPTITTINAGAFGNCPNLTGAGVTIPASVTTIEEGAFRNMSGILAYVVEAGNANYQVIGGDLYTADGATLLAYAAGKTDAAFAIPTTVTKIGAYAFNACKATTFTYADTMEVFDANVTVDKDAFDEPTLITCTDGNTCGVHTVVIDTEAVEPTCTATGMTKASHCSICGKIVSTATEIPALGHSYHPTTHKCIRCGALEPVAGLSYVSKGDGTCYVAGLGGYTSKDVTIDATSPAGDKVIAIADFAFANTAITSISIPTTVKTIGKGAFMNCSSLVITTSTVASGNEGGYTSDENAIYANDGKTLVRVGANKTTFTVGKDVTLIEDYAFAGCAKLTSVSVNNKNSYYKTSNNAIYTKLANGDLGDTLIRARNSASVTITAGTVHIAPGAFAGCNKLTSITLLATIEDIGDYAFYGCSALTSVTNNASDLKHVGTDAFTGTQVAAPPTGSAD